MTIADQMDEVRCDAFVDGIAVSIDRHVAKMPIGGKFTEPISEVMPDHVASLKPRDDGER